MKEAKGWEEGMMADLAISVSFAESITAEETSEVSLEKRTVSDSASFPPLLSFFLFLYQQEDEKMRRQQIGERQKRTDPEGPSSSESESY
jgi:hypothetical protein